MLKRRYERWEPTHEWSQIRPNLKDTAQIKYELIRPVILWGVSAKKRAAETGEPCSTSYYQANLFDVSGMASLLPPEPPPPVPKLDKRILPPPMRQAIMICTPSTLSIISMRSPGLCISSSGEDHRHKRLS